MAATACLALAPDPLTRVVLAVATTAAFAAGVWRFVLDDVERAGLRQLLA